MDMSESFEARTATLRAWLDRETVNAHDVGAEMQKWLRYFGFPAPSSAEMERLRAIEDAAWDVLCAYDERDEDMDWTDPAVDMILRRALTAGRHYAT